MKISGDGLVVLRLLICFHNFCSQVLKQFSALLSVLHAYCGTLRHATERLSEIFSILAGFSCHCYIASTCFLPKVSSNEHRMLDIKQFTHNFKKVPIILSSPFCVKHFQIWLFFSVFCVDPLHIKELNMFIPKHL